MTAITTEEGLEEWLLVFEIQELREEGEGLWVRQCEWYDGDLKWRVWSSWTRGGRGEHRQVGALKAVKREDRLMDRNQPQSGYIVTRLGSGADGADE